MKPPGYIFLKQLGKGNYGTVNLVEKNDKLLAVKYISLPDNEKVRQIMLKEVDNLKLLSSPCSDFVVCYHGSRIINNTLLIEMEYIDGVTLLNYFTILYREVDKPVYLNLCLAVLKDITNGLNYIHSKGIIHRDIKPDNILISGKTKIQIKAKIVDIGLGCTPITSPSNISPSNISPSNISPSNNTNITNNITNNITKRKSTDENKIASQELNNRELNNEKIVTLCPNKSVFVDQKNREDFKMENKEKETECCKGGAGTFLFSAPEVIIYRVSYFSSDMFSLGATMYRIITLENIYPLTISTADELKNFIKTQEYPVLNTPNKNLNLIVNNLLNRNYLLRYTSSDLLSVLADL